MEHIYNDGKEITQEEAHELKDKSKLCSSDKEVKFKKIKPVTKPKETKEKCQVIQSKREK